MIGWIISKLRLEPDSSDDMEYLDCIRDLIGHQTVRFMNFIMSFQNR
jgi:uncharacterized protein